MTLDDLAKLSKAASPGDWKLGSWADNIFAVRYNDKGDEVWHPVGRIKTDDRPIEESPDKANAAFIVACVSYVREQLAERGT